MPYKIHPACEASPAMSPERYEQFKSDIEKNGLVQPIILHKGKILDGRHRQRACDELGVEAEYLKDDELVETGGDPWAYVWSTMMRKNHSESQLSIYAAEWQKVVGPKKSGPKKKATDENASDPIGGNVSTNTEKGKLRDTAGEKFGITGRTVSKATNVLDKGCEALKEAVKDGSVNVSLAEKVAKNLTPKAQEKALAEAMASEKPEKVLRETVKPAAKEPQPFNLDDRSDKLILWLRKELESWPEEVLPQAFTFIKSVMAEFRK
ncbi:MAG: ParB N-terminal domain-containing protein [Planctomycetes bacterium]|nr:ParB N-terminal domain-containing protein [Planctomycetota bacterium]